MDFEALLDEFATPDNKVALEEMLQSVIYAWSLRRNARKSVAAIEKFRRGEPLTKKDVAAFVAVAQALPYVVTMASERARRGFDRFYDALDNIKAQSAADRATKDVMKDKSTLFTDFAGTADEPMKFESIADLSAWIKDYSAKK